MAETGKPVTYLRFRIRTAKWAAGLGILWGAATWILITSTATPVGHAAWTPTLFGLAAAANLAVAARPDYTFFRVAAVAAPILAAGSRILYFLFADPIVWFGAIVWGLVGWMTLLGDRAIPPPIRNGQAKRILDGCMD